MPLVGNSGQQVGDGSSVIQAGNDVIIGNSTSEIIQICELVVSSKMVSLKQEALMIAMDRAQEFGNRIANNIASQIDGKIESRLKDPDVQYAISQAVVQVATKGISEKNDLLQELIISKIRNEDEDQDLIIDLALEATKRTTSSELKLLGLIYYFRFCSKTLSDINITDIVNSEDDNINIQGITKQHCHQVFRTIYLDPAKDFDRITNGISTIKHVNIGMMEIKGLLNSGKVFSTSYFDIIKKRTGIDLSNSQEEFEKQFPELNSILKAFNIMTLQDLNSFTLSPVGSAIGHDYLKAKGFL